MQRLYRAEFNATRIGAIYGMFPAAIELIVCLVLDRPLRAVGILVAVILWSGVVTFASDYLGNRYARRMSKTGEPSDAYVLRQLDQDGSYEPPPVRTAAELTSTIRVPWLDRRQ